MVYQLVLSIQEGWQGSHDITQPAMQAMLHQPLHRVQPMTTPAAHVPNTTDARTYSAINSNPNRLPRQQQFNPEPASLPC
jgi:hypothetical protein